MDRWRGKVAIVTGASAGIGAAIAEKLVEEGLQVVGLARRVDRVQELSQKLANKPGKLYAIQTDLTVESEILAAFKWTEEHLGPVQILINNAGLGRRTSIINGDTSDWKKVLDTNLLGLAIATREAIRSLQKNNLEDGHIVNINSIVGHIVPNLPYQNMYPASKHGVTAFTETTRKELVAIGSKIKITSVSPGCVSTEIFEVNGFMDNSEVSKIIENAPALASEDVANAVLYVLGTPPHVQVSELTIKPVGEFF